MTKRENEVWLWICDCIGRPVKAKSSVYGDKVGNALACAGISCSSFLIWGLFFGLNLKVQTRKWLLQSERKFLYGKERRSWSSCWINLFDFGFIGGEIAPFSNPIFRESQISFLFGSFHAFFLGFFEAFWRRWDMGFRLALDSLYWASILTRAIVFDSNFGFLVFGLRKKSIIAMWTETGSGMEVSKQTDQCDEHCRLSVCSYQ